MVQRLLSVAVALEPSASEQGESCEANYAYGFTTVLALPQIFIPSEHSHGISSVQQLPSE